MKKIAMMLGACALLAMGAANAANGQAVANAKTACQNNPTQCAQAKSTAKDACAKNQTACNNAKAKAKSAVQK